MGKNLFLGAAAAAALLISGCKEDEPVVEAPVVSVVSESSLAVPAVGGQCEVRYSVANPVEGVALEVASDAAWLSNFAVDEAAVTFDVAENADEDVRTAEVVLSYKGAESVKVSVSQASAVYDSFVITVDKLLPSSVTLSCVPSSQEATYVFSVMKKSEFDEYGSDQAVMDADAAYVKENPGRLRKGNIDKEEFSLIYQGASYVVYAFGVTADGKITSKSLFKAEFDAPQRPSVSFGEVSLIPAEGGKVTVSYTVENPIEGEKITATAGYGVDWIHDIEVSASEISFVADANSAAEPESDPRTGFIRVSYPEAYNASLVFKQASPEKPKPTFDVKIMKLWSNKVVFTVTPSDLSCTYVAEVKNASMIEGKTDKEIVDADVASFTSNDWLGNPKKIEKRHVDEYGDVVGQLWEGAQSVTDDGISSYVKNYVIVVYGLDLDGNMTSESVTRVAFETAEAPVITVGALTPATLPADGGTYTVSYSISDRREGEAVEVKATGFGWGVEDWVHVVEVTDSTIKFTVDKNTGAKGYIDYRTCSLSISHADANNGTLKIMQYYPDAETE